MEEKIENQAQPAAVDQETPLDKNVRMMSPTQMLLRRFFRSKLSILGLVMMLLLAILGAEHLLTPGNILLYQLIWMLPGLLFTEWARSV